MKWKKKYIRAYNIQKKKFVLRWTWNKTTTYIPESLEPHKNVPRTSIHMLNSLQNKSRESTAPWHWVEGFTPPFIIRNKKNTIRNIKKQNKLGSYQGSEQECWEADGYNRTENETEWQLISQRRLLLDVQTYSLSA